MVLHRPVENVRIAVRVLGYPKDQLDRRKPEPPMPPPQPVVVEPPPADYAAFSDADELPIDAPAWRLKNDNIGPASQHREKAARRKEFVTLNVTKARANH
jgi:hypothetical protein